jgi:hypothetical protein
MDSKVRKKKKKNATLSLSLSLSLSLEYLQPVKYKLNTSKH